ncbi:hypothetical protein ROZALSC1DRAFT_2029, partial [Rozella allomycis CSF55]
GLWPRYLSYSTWADNTTVRRSTGFTPFQLMFGRDCLLPFDLEFNSFLGLDWTNVQNREDLLKMRLTQLEYFYEESQDARDKIFKSRLKGKFYHDAKKKKHPIKLQENDLVLVFEEIFETQTHGRKFVERYRGPYKIVKDLKNGAYYLAELDGSRLKGSYHGNRLRKFYCR